MRETVQTIILRLIEADELDTVERIGARYGVGLHAVLEPHIGQPTSDRPLGRAMVDLYVALEAKGCSIRRIAWLTGRDRSTVRDGLSRRARKESARALTRAAFGAGVCPGATRPPAPDIAGLVGSRACVEASQAAAE